MTRRVFIVCMLLLFLAGFFLSCKTKERLKVGTTTSLYDTGLLYLIEDAFEKRYKIDVHFLPVGTGICFEYGRRGDVDLILVHNPEGEEKFLKEGYGILRKTFAYNYFLIAGPEDDPAGIKGKNPAQAMRLIAEKGCPFVSRGDESGTHAKEKTLWEKAGFSYEKIRNSPWYVEAGRGMGGTLLMANEFRAYTISDVGTFIAYRDKLKLVPLVEKGEELLNPYSAILINPELHPHINCEGARLFINFLLSPEVQKLIGNFGLKEYKRNLFFPVLMR